MTAAPRLRFSFQEYLVVDEGSEARHEYLDGMILGMAGGSPEHARLAVAVASSLARQLEGRRCAVFSEALRIRAVATGFAGYPDVTVVCEELQRDPESAVTVINPTVVVEILSPSTAEYDSTEKLSQYQRIATIAHIVLVAHDSPRIDVWSRQGADWGLKAYGAGTQAELPAIGCTLEIDAIFRDPLQA